MHALKQNKHCHFFQIGQGKYGLFPRLPSGVPGGQYEAVGDIQQKLLPHPLAPLLPSLSMKRGTETSVFTTEGQLLILGVPGRLG